MSDSEIVDWRAVLGEVAESGDPASMGALVFDTVGHAYSASVDDCHPMFMEEKGCSFLFDQAGAVDAVQADRTLAAWAVTPHVVDRRDTWYQSGFPIAELGDGTARDRGHLIPHLSGGKFGPNIFAQDRALNRGWSDEGKRYRAIERLAAASPGAFFFGRLTYLDDTDYPGWVEIGTVIHGTVHSGRFNNRNAAVEPSSHADG